LTQTGLKLDYLINNVGMPKNFIDTTNVVETMLVAQRFMPYLEKAEKHAPMILMNMSRGLARIANTRGAFQTSHSASKAAFDILTVSLAIENPFALASGRLKTEVGGPSVALEIDFSVSDTTKFL